VTLVNEDAVNFLADCEAGNIKLENCPAYIREWIERAKGRTLSADELNQECLPWLRSPPRV